MTDREIRDALARVEAYLRRVCPTMDLRADVRRVMAALDERLAEPDAFADLAPPRVFDLFSCGVGPF